MSRRRHADSGARKAAREAARRKPIEEMLAKIRAENAALGPGEIGFSSNAPPVSTFLEELAVISIGIALVVVLGGLIWGGFWLLARGDDAAEHDELVHRTLPPKPEYPAKYAAITATDEHGAHQICVFAYEICTSFAWTNLIKSHSAFGIWPFPLSHGVRFPSVSSEI